MRLIYRFSAELFSLCHRYDPCQTMDRMHATRRDAYLAAAPSVFVIQVRRSQVLSADASSSLRVRTALCLSVCLSVTRGSPHTTNDA